jgi:transposase
MRATTVLRPLLGIENIIVTGCYVDPLGNQIITARPSWLVPRCWECGRKARGSTRPGTRGRRWRHLDLAGVASFLEYERPRVHCRKCRGWRAAKVPWADDPQAMFTRKFDEQAAWWAQRTDKTSVATALRIAWTTVGRCIERVANRLRPLDPLAGLRFIGVDEISYRKHHRYLTVVVDHESGKIVWMKKGKNADTLKAFFDELGEERCAKIQVVTADMSAAYTKAVREKVPAAQLVYDRFHVQKLVGEALDATRREEWRRLKKDSPGEARTIKGSRWALLRNPKKRTAKEKIRLARLATENKRLFRASLLKDQFVEIMNRRQPNVAKRMLKDWLGWASRSQLPAFVKVAKTIRKHLDDIAAYWQHRWSNGVVEGLNNKARLVTRRAYGFHSADAAIAMIMLCCSDIDVPVPINSIAQAA